MSKLDYVTVAIVGICILAIVFLVYKMTDLFKGDKPTDKIETVADSVEIEGDDVYDYTLDDAVDSTGAGETDQSAATNGTSSGTTAPAETPKTTTPPAESTTPPASTSTTTSSSGKYMVLAGTFSQKSGAETQVAQLKKLGFENASVEIFNRGKYAVVLVDRFDTMAEAERLSKELTEKKVNNIIKAQQGQ